MNFCYSASPRPSLTFSQLASLLFLKEYQTPQDLSLYLTFFRDPLTCLASSSSLDLCINVSSGRSIPSLFQIEPAFLGIPFLYSALLFSIKAATIWQTMHLIYVIIYFPSLEGKLHKGRNFLSVLFTATYSIPKQVSGTKHAANISWV